ncbi:uncharacterized protein PADG_07985 [Paracoccidioides brasiliensis Pb18]|uniref:Uncharacterized protein n=1 Tax=Paracoccidioides brasiliensis (strain Pb18) TaxID=502780 RepID=C1GKX8_PARBD|nr:uncharacterized protein PADG_07985 [Paracoccidioides brasiliensis Pb18]EEH43165.2 hypothetical protein PADG_07985 [Paracoccidioides brasiliensis Pb18]
MLLSYGSSFFLLALAIVGNADSCTWAQGEDRNPEGLPICEKCVSREDILAPGIGFDIADSYGTAAIRYFNGSTENLAKVDGDEHYQAFIGKLAAGPPSPDCSMPKSLWEKFLCWRLGVQRKLNKSRGLPATHDVETLGTLFKTLRLAVDDKLGDGSCTRVLFAFFPVLPGLTFEDFHDAVEYAGLSHIDSPYGQDYVSEVSAAGAAMGYGICRNFTDVYDCLNEENSLPWSQKLFLSFTDASFTAVNTYSSNAFYIHWTSKQVHFDLGWGSFPVDAGEDMQRDYWQRLRDTIVQVGLECEELPSTLLLVGEHASNPEFQETLKEALQDMFSSHNGDVDNLRLTLEKDEGALRPASIDYEFLVARGAAVFAKRSLEALNFCWEPPECDEDRGSLFLDLLNKGSAEQVVLDGAL